jgi:hypothetical protein
MAQTGTTAPAGPAARAAFFVARKDGKIVMAVIKLPAARVRQGALVLYATALKVRDLVADNFSSVDTLDPDDPGDNGYQRC